MEEEEVMDDRRHVTPCAIVLRMNVPGREYLINIAPTHPSF